MGNKQIDRSQLVQIQRRTSLSSKEIKEWYAVFTLQFQDNKVTREKFTSSMKNHYKHSSNNNNIHHFILNNHSSDNNNLTNDNSLPNSPNLNISTNLSSPIISEQQQQNNVKASSTSTSPIHINNNINTTNNATNNSNNTATTTTTTVANHNNSNLTTTTTNNNNNNNNSIQNQQQSLSNFSNLCFDTNLVSFCRYFNKEEIPPSKKQILVFPHFIPTFETFSKQNKSQMVDWGYSVITCNKRMELIEDGTNKQKQPNGPLSISFQDLLCFLEIIFNYMDLKVVELNLLPEYLRSAELCTRYIFVNVLNHFGMDSSKDGIPLESRMITKQQFMEYCLANLSK
ncbi:hypothetical protein ABK040_000214 [Willaertia magna]